MGQRAILKCIASSDAAPGPARSRLRGQRKSSSCVHRNLFGSCESFQVVRPAPLLASFLCTTGHLLLLFPLLPHCTSWKLIIGHRLMHMHHLLLQASRIKNSCHPAAAPRTAIEKKNHTHGRISNFYSATKSLDRRGPRSVCTYELVTQKKKKTRVSKCHEPIKEPQHFPTRIMEEKPLQISKCQRHTTLSN